MASRADVVLAAAVGGVVLAAGVAGVLAATRPTAAYQPGTPEAAVQQYLSAIVDHRSQDALALLSSHTPCTATDLAQASWSDVVRVDLVRTDASLDLTTVDVRISSDTGDPFGGTWEQETSFVLRSEDGQWRITGSPWPMLWCDEKAGS